MRQSGRNHDAKRVEGGCGGGRKWKVQTHSSSIRKLPLLVIDCSEQTQGLSIGKDQLGKSRLKRRCVGRRSMAGQYVMLWTVCMLMLGELKDGLSWEVVQVLFLPSGLRERMQRGNSKQSSCRARARFERQGTIPSTRYGYCPSSCVHGLRRLIDNSSSAI